LRLSEAEHDFVNVVGAVEGHLTDGSLGKRFQMTAS
jgi:hypothetical protein